MPTEEDFIIIDYSQFTGTVVWCKKCNVTEGPYQDLQVARRVAATHRTNFHGTPCSEEGCTETARTKGLCVMHYNRRNYRASKKEAL